jgi:hypothetical protein
MNEEIGVESLMAHIGKALADAMVGMSDRRLAAAPGRRQKSIAEAKHRS